MLSRLTNESSNRIVHEYYFKKPLFTQTCVVVFFSFVGTNVKEHGRLAKKRQIWSNSRQREKADKREMVVLPREMLLEILRRKV